MLLIKFIHSEKATTFCEIFTLLLSYEGPKFCGLLRIYELYLLRSQLTKSELHNRTIFMSNWTQPSLDFRIKRIVRVLQSVCTIVNGFYLDGIPFSVVKAPQKVIYLWPLTRPTGLHAINFQYVMCTYLIPYFCFAFCIETEPSTITHRQNI